MSILSEEQIASFASQGYLKIPKDQHGLVNIEDLQKWTTEVYQWPREGGKWMIYDEVKPNKDRQIMRTEKIADYHLNFEALFNNKKVFQLLHEVTGKDMLLFKDKINYKLPGANGFVAHIDAPAYEHMNDKKLSFVEMMIAIDPQSAENGCLEMVPASHKSPIPLANGGRLDLDWEVKASWVPVTTQPGDMLIFVSTIAHRSGPNPTAHRRAATFGTYHFELDQPDMRDRYYRHRREVFPPDHERVEGEKYEAGFKLFGYSSPFSAPGSEKPSYEIKV